MELADQKRVMAEDLPRRMQLGRRLGAQKGWYQGGVIPYGYRKGYDREAGRFKLEPDPYEASVVRTIFQEYVRLQSLGRLVKRLKHAGIRNRESRFWSRQALSFLLNNEAYLGKLKFAGVAHEGQHPPIVSPALFEKVKEIKARNYRRK